MPSQQRVKRDNFPLELLALAVSGDADAARALAVIAYPNLGKLGSRLDPGKLRDKAEMLAGRLRKFGTCLGCGCEYRIDSDSDDRGSCSQCAADAQKERKLIRLQRELQALSPDELRMIMFGQAA